MRLIASLLAVVTACALAAWGIRDWCVRPLRCDAGVTEVKAATAAFDSLRGLYEKEARADHNIGRLRELREQCRTDVQIPFLLGINASVAGHQEDAVVAFKEALELDRRPEIYVELGHSLLQLGRIDEAVGAYSQAARFGYGPRDFISSEEIVRRVEETISHH